MAFWGASALRRLAGRARTVMRALATDVVVTIRFLSRISLTIERHNSSVNGTQGEKLACILDCSSATGCHRYEKYACQRIGVTLYFISL